MATENASGHLEWGAKATYERYVELLPEYRRALDQVVNKLSNYLESQGLTPFNIDSRPKTPVSLYKKQLKKNYANPWADCKDILGVRIIVSLASEKDKIRSVLESASSPFAVEKVEDKEETREYLSLVYGGLHMDLTDESPSESLGERIGFEVQIRSIAEHTWAETEHAYIYKGPSGIPDRTKRQFARILALVELMDLELDRGVEAVSKLETYGLHHLSLSLAKHADELSLSAGSATITRENIEELCMVLVRDPNELQELTNAYVQSNGSAIREIVDKIGPNSSAFDVDRHLLLAQPELLLIAALLDENPYKLATALEGSPLKELVLPLAREMGKGRQFAKN